MVRFLVSTYPSIIELCLQPNKFTLFFILGAKYGKFFGLQRTVEGSAQYTFAIASKKTYLSASAASMPCS